jgi:hypothetical protein
MPSWPQRTTTSTQKLPDGFRREGHPAIDKLIGIAVLLERVRITANAHGNLRFVYER